MEKVDLELLNNVYRDISLKFGVDTAVEMYNLFKGQQVTFPVRLFNGAKISKVIKEEYDGTNHKELAAKYGYSEKSIRRMLKDEIE